MKDSELILNNSPKIDGLRFRKFAGESDFPGMLALLRDAAVADNDEVAFTLEGLQYDYAHLTHSDPYQDMVMAEIHGALVAYSRVEWNQEEKSRHRIYFHLCKVHPQWRNQGIEAALFEWNESRLSAIAAAHPQDGLRFFQTSSSEFQEVLNANLEAFGYTPQRYFIKMSRPLEAIPAADLPAGVEVRPVEKKDIKKIWRASIEAFKDHWGFSEPKEEDFLTFKGSKYFQPELWQVAWVGDEVVSSVMNYIDQDFNQKFNKKRGWTEDISTCKAWRRRGIAKALIVRSMQMHKERGMREVALSVDTDNPTGALKLYQDLGYEKYHTMVVFRKAFPSNTR